MAASHAYSILDLKQVDSTRLLKVRNPWGRGEWNGAYSDNSNKWTTRLRNAVGFNPDSDAKEDGIFWIELSDYATAFDTTFICMDLGQKEGM